jgi:hypothetical protein
MIAADWTYRGVDEVASSFVVCIEQLERVLLGRLTQPLPMEIRLKLKYLIFLACINRISDHLLVAMHHP